MLEDQAEGDPIVNSPLHDGYNSIDEERTNRKNAGNNNENYARMSSVSKCQVEWVVGSMFINPTSAPHLFPIVN